MLWYGAPCCSAHTYMIAITALFIRGVSADADGCVCARMCKPPLPKKTFTVTCTEASSRFSHHAGSKAQHTNTNTVFK